MFQQDEADGATCLRDFDNRDSLFIRQFGMKIMCPFWSSGEDEQKSFPFNSDADDAGSNYSAL